jgi:hypothetical protein
MTDDPQQAASARSDRGPLGGSLTPGRAIFKLELGVCAISRPATGQLIYLSRRELDDLCHWAMTEGLMPALLAEIRGLIRGNSRPEPTLDDAYERNTRSDRR